MATIEASADTLMRQAPSTIQVYLHKAVEFIDDQFGEGYAQEHPELVAAFIKAAADDFNVAIASKVFEESVDKIVSILEGGRS